LEGGDRKESGQRQGFQPYGVAFRLDGYDQLGRQPLQHGDVLAHRRRRHSKRRRHLRVRPRAPERTFELAGPGDAGQMFERMTVPSGLTIEDLRKVTAPMLIATGDRDMFCPAEEAVAAYQMLSPGELAIVPGLGHELSTAMIDLTIDFLDRHGR
jgi:pimeloyl-ACP methyl ester carboxylesterase